jgi:hypothetical protein
MNRKDWTAKVRYRKAETAEVMCDKCWHYRLGRCVVSYAIGASCMLAVKSDRVCDRWAKKACLCEPKEGGASFQVSAEEEGK